MTTEHGSWLAQHQCGAPAVRPEVCSCGQELDVCTGPHCPRCGTTLAARAA